ncbi:MAG: hypothetical protein A2887_04465 [Alphaproteobacteria bacterium RIFCSPLOWO2_01_FULL_40_26]|nr:MAG: hypothetical protein A3D15_03480 [Alphaproteobacteria bacterium RIFCSPHIGHO2_02_FULL_40_34]OFW95196.1 MAG: hypothetical protein A2887_04465 [Alphaproteobacteria bacterium RIFCSPLOWO2_01_FULL_40_26]OFX09969.1 MAG: hypothetical protein A3H30_02750 [Alphaproteobacteria bacterium RIFCSPLOWO2_02_FULL_40_19]OFX12337.1 MAG: hypothetical protein A3G22_03570 [Alphaproteobacteria bacterium RIFCSPLOWO2_12_FULL_40_11]
MSYGLTMYESLKKNCTDFHLYIFAFDDKACEDLKNLALKHTTIISLQEFEDEELLKIKPGRSKGEYCWTCTPSTILYVLKNFAAPSCTYLDADLYFFSDPKILIEELAEKSVSIIPHRYEAKYDQSKISGKYCVQFMTFKNNAQAMEVLKWWHNRCIEWCFAEPENGKFGDQKYLDDWLTRFDCVKELQNLGGGVAPWNVLQYNFFTKNDKIFGVEKKSGKKFELIFFHFHGFKILDEKTISLTGSYKITTRVRNLIYKKYTESMLNKKFKKSFRQIFPHRKNNKINIAAIWPT